MAPTSNNQQVVDVEDSKDAPERRRTQGTQPAKRIKKPARKENASEAGEPGVSPPRQVSCVVSLAVDGDQRLELLLCSDSNQSIISNALSSEQHIC
jgi:hypothetical protein